MEVFEHEHKRSAGGQRLERLGHLAHHPLARRPGRLAEKPFAISVIRQPRHLRQPRRRQAPQYVDDADALPASRQLCQRFEHRDVGLATTVVLEALAPRSLHPFRQRRFEGVNQRGLADTSLTGDENDLAFARPRPCL